MRERTGEKGQKGEKEIQRESERQSEWVPEFVLASTFRAEIFPSLLKETYNRYKQNESDSSRERESE